MLELISGLGKELAPILGSQELSTKLAPAPVSLISPTAEPLGVLEIKLAVTFDPSAATIESAEIID